MNNSVNRIPTGKHRPSPVSFLRSDIITSILFGHFPRTPLSRLKVGRQPSSFAGTAHNLAPLHSFPSTSPLSTPPAFFCRHRHSTEVCHLQVEISAGKSWHTIGGKSPVFRVLKMDPASTLNLHLLPSKTDCFRTLIVRYPPLPHLADPAPKTPECLYYMAREPRERRQCPDYIMAGVWRLLPDSLCLLLCFTRVSFPMRAVHSAYRYPVNTGIGKHMRNQGSLRHLLHPLPLAVPPSLCLSHPSQ